MFKMNNKIMFAIYVVAMVGVLCFLLPLATAQLTFTPEEQADIKLSCFDVDSDFCEATTTCNITTFYPNMTILVDNQEMTNNINYFNYTTAVILSERGEYNNVVKCIDGSDNGYVSFVFTVTSIPATGQGNVAIGILLSMVGLSFLFIYIGFKFSDSEKLFPIALFFILIALIVSIYVIHLGYIYSRDLLNSSMAMGGQYKIYFGLMYSLLGVGFIAMVGLIFKTIAEIRERKSVIRYGEGYNSKTGVYDH